jgi:glycosyltransferase involved in cell wall biosynthesis
LMTLLGHLRRRGPAIFVTLHEVLRDTAQTRAPGRALYRRLAGLADCVILHTEAARAALAGPVGARADHVSVVPHPRARLPAAQTTPAELRRRHGLGADPVLLAFGFVHVDKGLDDLVRAYARLRRRGRHGGARLVVAGAVRPRQGPFRAFEVRDRLHLARMRRLVRAARLQDRVTFTGYVPGGEVRPWFELAAAAVLPYRRIDQSGVAGLAGAAGTPVLLSTAGGLAEAETADWTFPPRAPERLAGVLEAFLAAAPERRAGAAPAVTAPDLDGFVRATLAAYAPGCREGEEVIDAVPA